MPALSYRELIDAASTEVQEVEAELFWREWHRFSFRQKDSQIMGGVMGTITYEGNIKPFLPLLKLMEYLHVGKGTAFGLGRYKMQI